MFKSARWRSEKNKIKVVFKLQFQATQVPQLAKDSLMVSLVPVEVGKPTVRLEKSSIRDGTCTWEHPIYETVKFTQESKTGKINEKLYQFIVSTGSSKAGVFGEVSINIADYFDSIKPSSLSFPLKASNSGTILHITIQRMYGAVDQRDAEENVNATIEPQDRSLRSKFSECETDENRNCNSIEDVPVNKTASQNNESNGNVLTCKSSDGTSASGSDSSSERNTPRETGLQNSIQRRGSGSFLPSLNHSLPHTPTTKAIITNYLEHQRSNTDWSVGSALDGSVDESTNSSEENLMKERTPRSSDTPIEKLKSELVVLARKAEVSDLEIQTLRKQIVKESRRGQELSREVISLKEERDALKQECEQLRGSCKHTDGAKISTKLQYESKDSCAPLQEIREELNHEKDLNANLRIQLLKTQESNSELILAVQDLDVLLEQKNRELSYLSKKSAIKENAEDLQDIVPKHEMEEDKEQHALETLVKEHEDARETYLLEQKIIDLYSEIELYRRDKDELEMQMEQIALDYEILKQENHNVLSKLEQNNLQEQLKAQYECSDPLANVNELESQVESLENELKKKEEDLSTSLVTINELKSQIGYLENELKKKEEDFSTSLVTINELKSEIEYLEKELEKQGQAFEDDLDTVMHAKVEQEQRAIRAEEALRKTRLINANTAERLQEEFRRLSTQMTSTFDANEKLAKKAVMEANELRVQKTHLEEMLEKANEDLSLIRDQYEERLKDLSHQLDLAKEKAEQAMSALEEESTKLEHQKKQDEEIRGGFSKEIQMLQDEIEKLKEAISTLSKQAKEKEELQVEIQKLKASMAESELLVQREYAERNDLERNLASVKKEADKCMDELKSTKSIKEDKEKIVGNLQSEIETLKAQYSHLEHSLFEDEIEKEYLRKQVSNLKVDLKKKEEVIACKEKKLKAGFDGTKSYGKNNKVVPAHGSKEVAAMRERIKLLEGQITLKEAALENSNNSFLEKQKDLLHKIEELENRTMELDNNSKRSCEDQLQKEVKSTETLIENSSKDEGMDIAKNLASNMEVKNHLSDQNGIKSTNKLTLNKLLISTSHDGDYRNLDELLSAMALMKERNESMEYELKDMQERYSEISLKFAEVEGERQQLVMTVRNLTKKN